MQLLLLIAVVKTSRQAEQSDDINASNIPTAINIVNTIIYLAVLFVINVRI